ncbi:hypothetical protein [[Clostridium] colinum]|nr:hypothetical protein [[Clostridium] colinum]
MVVIEEDLIAIFLLHISGIIIAFSEGEKVLAIIGIIILLIGISFL